MGKKKRAKKPRRPDQTFQCFYCKKTVTCYHPRWLKPSWWEGGVNGVTVFWCSRQCGVNSGVFVTNL